MMSLEASLASFWDQKTLQRSVVNQTLFSIENPMGETRKNIYSLLVCFNCWL